MKTKASVCMFLLIVLTPLMASAQFGKDSGLWDFQRFPADKSLVVVGDEYSGHGSGVYIEQGILTCQHVIDSYIDISEEGVVSYRDVTIIYQDGTRGTGTILKQDKSVDLALIKPNNPPPNHTKAAIAKSNLKPDEKALFAGFGRRPKSDQLRSWSDEVSRIPFKGRNMFDSIVVPGDSGGGCFNSDGELAGLISGGFFPYHDDRLGNLAVGLATGPNTETITQFLK